MDESLDYEDEGPDYDSFEPRSGDMDERELLKRMKKHLRESEQHSSDWREEAYDCFEEDAGRQWAEADELLMEERGRPVVTFNRTSIFVQAVCGLEAINRQEVIYLPRNGGPTSGASDVLTGAARYVNQDTAAEYEHAQAFRDMVTCGMGWTETRMDFDTNRDGDIAIEKVDPLEMYWDPRARRQNLKDAKWVMRIRPMTLEDVKAEWPDKADEIKHTGFFTPHDPGSESPVNTDTNWLYESGTADGGLDDDDIIYVAQYQWIEKRKVYRTPTPLGVKDFDEDQWETLKADYPGVFNRLDSRKLTTYRTVVRQAFAAGDTILEQMDLKKDWYTLNCMTGVLDRNEGAWYGIVRNIKSPQEWVNKLFSEILWIINTNAKGGLIAELSAIEDIQKFKEDWAQPDTVSFVADGALSGQMGPRIMPRNPPQYPTGLDKLLTVAMTMFTEVTGVNMELLGLAEKVQPGVLEAQRKQAGMTILSWAFTALSAYRHRHGRILAQFIRDNIADGRLVRILGQDGTEQYIPLIRDELAVEYDIVVSESPTSPNEKDRVFALLIQLLPYLEKMGILPPAEILDYLPLPKALIEKWKQQLDAQQQSPQVQLGVREKTAEVAEKETKAKVNLSQVELNLAKAEEARNKPLTTGGGDGGEGQI